MLRSAYYALVGPGRPPEVLEIRGVAVLFLLLFTVSGLDITVEAGYGPEHHGQIPADLGAALCMVGIAMFLVFADFGWLQITSSKTTLPLNTNGARVRIYMIGLAAQGVLTALVVMLTGGLFRSPYAIFLLGGILLAQITAGTSRLAVSVLLPFALLCVIAGTPALVSSLAVKDWPTSHAIAPTIIVIAATSWVNTSSVAERAALRRATSGDAPDDLSCGAGSPPPAPYQDDDQAQ